MVKQVLLYLPVMHKGYDALFERHKDADEVLLLGSGFAAVFPALGMDAGALSAASAAALIALAVDKHRIRVVETGDLPGAVVADELVMPDEAMMRELAAAYGLHSGRHVTFDVTFLHWDRGWSRPGRPEGFAGRVATAGTPRRVMQEAQGIGLRGSDWWRRVGAVAVRGETVLGRAHGSHRPTEYSPYINGDPRDNFSRGIRADLSTAAHAEAALIGQAARQGIALSGADLYVTTFPCPTCARLIVCAGFSRCFFSGAYSLSDGDGLFHDAGIETIWVS